MRPTALLPLLLLLPGCEAAVPLVAANGVSLMLTGRAVPDLVYSGITGQDCSIAYLDLRQRYCRAEPQPAEQPYCTRSLGAVDCWHGPPPGNPPPRPVGQAIPGAPPQPWPDRLL